jgi:hypothetical protein
MREEDQAVSVVVGSCSTANPLANLDKALPATHIEESLREREGREPIHYRCISSSQEDGRWSQHKQETTQRWSSNSSLLFLYQCTRYAQMYLRPFRFLYIVFLQYSESVVNQRPKSWTKFKQKSKSFPHLFSQSPLQLCHEISISSSSLNLLQLLHTVKEEGGKRDRKPYPLPYGLRNPYRNLKSENSQETSIKLYVHEFGFWLA